MFFGLSQCVCVGGGGGGARRFRNSEYLAYIRYKNIIFPKRTFMTCIVRFPQNYFGFVVYM